MKAPLQILCILPSIKHAHFARRIAMMQQAGFEVEVVGFERDGHAGGSPDCRVESLGHITYSKLNWRHLMTRIIRMMPFFSKIRAAIRRNDIVYAFSQELAFMAMTAGIGLRKPTVVEVIDISELQTSSGMRGKIIRAIDKRVTAACKLLVVTSPHYYIYYRDWLKLKIAGLVIENKVDTSFVANNIEATELTAPASRPLRIGYFGILRDEWSLQLIELLSRSAPEMFDFVLAGVPGRFIDDLSQRVARIPNVEYRGSYSHPDDLPALFSLVDMVLACYSPEIPLGWSQSNRYYQACLFRKPLIVRAGTVDADETRRHDIGLIIEDSDVKLAANALRSITPEDWERWSANMTQLPREIYTYTEEGDALRYALTWIVSDQTQIE